MEEKFPLVKKSNTYKLIIPSKVEDKIRYVCNRISEVEWSGVLFVKYSGSFESNLTITCEDILVMNIGSSAYTEFNMTPEVVSFIQERQLFDCQMALIHSHNHMPTFLSGTDIATLQEEGSQKNTFVSLIVNNAGNYTAAITRRVQLHQEGIAVSRYNLFGEEATSSESRYTEDNTIVEYFMLDIIKENSYYKALDERLKELNTPRVPINNTPVSTTIKLKEPITPPKNYGPLFEDNLKESMFKESVEEGILDCLIAQILTGCVIINNNKFDAFKWARNLEKLYDKRFDDNHGGFDAFRTWAENHCETVIWHVGDEYLESIYDYPEIAAIYANKIIEKLEKLPKNKYIEEFIDILNMFTEV